MPTYQYRCTECGRDLEVVQKFSDPSLSECPTCAGALRKVFNAVGVVFKGSGFYRNDSRVGADKNGDGGSDRKSADTTTDTKPVTTDASKTADGGTVSAPSKAAEPGRKSEPSTRGSEATRASERKKETRSAVGAGAGSSSSTGSKAASS